MRDPKYNYSVALNFKRKVRVKYVDAEFKGRKELFIFAASIILTSLILSSILSIFLNVIFALLVSLIGSLAVGFTVLHIIQGDDQDLGESNLRVLLSKRSNSKQMIISNDLHKNYLPTLITGRRFYY